MSTIPALSSAVFGIQKGLADMDRNAAKVASAEAFNSDNPVDLARPMVEIKSNRLQIEASARVLKTTDEMIGSLLDVFA